LLLDEPFGALDSRVRVELREWLHSGRVRSGKAEVGSLVVEAPPNAREGESVHAFVHPHDIKIARPPQGSTDPEVPRSELEHLSVVEGDCVRADVRMARVFPGDFAI
jgi:sulfate/thiosulfate transport system ATP-binding protein